MTALFERELDVTEAVRIVLMRIPPGEYKSVRQIHRARIGLRPAYWGDGGSGATEATRAAIGHQFRNFPGWFPNLELDTAANGILQGVRHVG